MCIILTCEANVRPSYDLVEGCFMSNPDGAGIMWCEHGKVQTSKGFRTTRALMDAIDAVPNESRLVIHMRIATSGGITTGTCHPFPICDQLDALHAADTECWAAIAHNGVIQGVPTDASKGISDTVYFVSNYVTSLLRETGGLTKSAQRRIKEAAPGNRFAIMTSDGKVYRLGKGWQTVTKGIQASNASWRYSSYLFDKWNDYDMYAEDGFGEHDEYEAVFEMCCGDCVHRASCMCYGPMCGDVADYIEMYFGDLYEQEDEEIDWLDEVDWMAS